MEHEAHKAVDYILRNRDEFSKAKAERCYLEEFRKSKKALLMAEALQMGIEAANAQERFAYSHIDYIALLDGIKQAIEREEFLKWGMEAARMRVDIWRSQEASNRMQDRVTS
jgi:hypothetical protein